MKERWKKIPGINGNYEASSLGRIRNEKGKILKPWISSKYLYVNLGARYRKGVHRLILMAFTGPPPPKYDGSHLNGNRLDNRASNLKWCSRKENHSHKIKHGTLRLGSKHQNSKITEQDVRFMRRAKKLFGKRLPNETLAKKFGLNRRTVDRIIYGKGWYHVK